jgi:hypothetical protein
MIDEIKLAALKTQQARTHVRGQVPAPAHLPVPTLREQLQSMSEKDLRTLQDLLNELLPEQSVKELNLEDELMQQYTKTKRLMDEIAEDIDIPPNQKAQVGNSVVTTLTQLRNLQEDLRVQEGLKLSEDVLKEMLQTMPEEFKAEFFEEYHARAKKIGLA